MPCYRDLNGSSPCFALPENRLFLVLDYAIHGGLKQYLLKNLKGVKDDWPILVGFMGDIINGLTRIHERNLVHRFVRSIFSWNTDLTHMIEIFTGETCWFPSGTAQGILVLSANPSKPSFPISVKVSKSARNPTAARITVTRRSGHQKFEKANITLQHLISTQWDVSF